MTQPHTVTGLLHAWRRGDRAALDRLMPLVYDELHRLASRAMRGVPQVCDLHALGPVLEDHRVHRPVGVVSAL